MPDIIPSQWRLLHLTMHKANGKRLDMQFLRPLEWMKANGAQLGATIDLDLPEFGAKGPAKVVSIKACPSIKSGPGNVVTGKFIHESDGNLINLRIKGQQEPTTVTANHRYWSA
ncbi:MAG: type IV secretion protein Rhs, partial [Gimesia sp.]|nr:type IV secretion protein Rhs [Gimesia sp.]